MTVTLVSWKTSRTLKTLCAVALFIGLIACGGEEGLEGARHTVGGNTSELPAAGLVLPERCE